MFIIHYSVCTQIFEKIKHFPQKISTKFAPQNIIILLYNISAQKYNFFLTKNGNFTGVKTYFLVPEKNDNKNSANKRDIMHNRGDVARNVPTPHSAPHTKKAAHEWTAS